jgi:hypothetical protein
MIDDDISKLLEFSERCGPEVEARGLIGLQLDQSAMIERFIAGHCNDAERRELSRFLQSNPAWIRRIADRVKGTRELSDPALAGEN